MWNQEVGKGSAEPARQYKKHEYRSMHSDEGIVSFRLNFSALGPLTQHVFQPGKGRIRITELQPKQYRHQTTEYRPYHPGYQELFTDHFMILAEYIFCYKSLFVVMGFMLSVGIVRNDCLTGSMYRQISTHQ